MTTNPGTHVSTSGAPHAEQPPLRSWSPGLLAVSIYMLLLAVVFVVGVVTHDIGPLYLVFSAFFIAAGVGLLYLRRWAWALSLAAVTVLVGLFFWIYATQRVPSAVIQALINLVIFLYLVRAEVRAMLK